MRKIIIHSVLVFMLVALAIAGAAALIHRNNTYSTNKNQWYSVRLTGGQVYFGHISAITPDTIVLADAYYLQVYTPPEPEPLKGNNFQVHPAPSRPVYSVARPSSDAIAPSDNTLYIDRRVVILWEKINNDSPVVKMMVDGEKK